MLSSQALIIRAAEIYPPEELHLINTSAEQSAIIAQREAIHHGVASKHAAAIVLSLISAIILVFFVDSLLVLLLPVAVIVGGLPLVRVAEAWLSYRFYRRPFQPTTQLLTTRVAYSGSQRINTTLVIEDESRILESLPIDLGNDDSIALAASVQVRNEQALRQLRQWRRNPISVGSAETQRQSIIDAIIGDNHSNC